MRTGDIILARVSEISATMIKYKRYDVADGPEYTELKVNVTGINYANGFKEDFKSDKIKPKNTKNIAELNMTGNKIYEFRGRLVYHDTALGEKKLLRVLLNSKDKDIINLGLKQQRAGRMSKAGIVAMPFATFAVVTGALGLLMGDAPTRQVALGFALVAVPLGITGLVNSKNHYLYKRDAVKLYNQKY